MYGSDTNGWGEYPDSRDEEMRPLPSGIGALVTIGALGALAYVPDLAAVGSGSAGTYYPRDTSADARALNYLGFFPDPFLATHVGTTGSRQGDSAAAAGAWSPAFQQAVRDFQVVYNLVVDGWIGPATRKSIAVQVAAKNANELPDFPPHPNPLPIPVPPNPIPVPPNPIPVPPNPGPAPAPAKDNTIRNVAIGAGALGVLGLGYFLLKD